MIRMDAVFSSSLEAGPVRIAPAFSKFPPPVIVIGMHRSGTSMVAGMLSNLGVFMDPAFPYAQLADGVHPNAQSRTLGYAESIAFQNLDVAIMARAGATWFDIDPFLACRDQPLFARLSITQMQLATYGSLLKGHLALHPDPSAGFWGWKDPRTSLMLPYWLRLFPNARLLHVRRQEDAIVRSLVLRATQQSAASASAPPPTLQQRATRLLRDPGLLLPAIGHRLGMRSTPTVIPDYTTESYAQQCRCLTNRYVQECLVYRRLGDRYLEIWYEDILDDLEASIARIANFAQLSPSDRALQAAINLVGRDRRPARPLSPRQDFVASSMISHR